MSSTASMLHTVRPPQFSKATAAVYDGGFPRPHSKEDRDSHEDTIKKTITNLLDGTSGKLKVVPINSVNLDLRHGDAHSTTGIPYTIAGTATEIASTVAMGLLESQDPIKAIFSTEVHQKHKIMITRKYVVGGGAQETPERAPARTVSVQEDHHEVTMARFGGDLEMNLNLFLIPAAAKEELDLKLGAQKLMLENKLIELGYDAVMQNGTNIVNAIMRSNPTYASMRFHQPDGGSEFAPWKVRVAADRIYATQIFGALQKHKYAVPNLLATVKYASAYTLGTIQNPVIVLPHGVANILKYARPESMRYDVSGVPTKDGKKLTMALDRSFVDAVTGANILIHYPRPSYEMGSIQPRVGPGGLSGLCKTVMWYGSPNNQGTDGKFSAVDFNDGGKLTVDTKGDALEAKSLYVRVVEAAMSSAIVAAPGGKSGRLLVGYPMTGVSTSQATETMRIQLRTYLGAAVTDPESLFILPNVTFEGITSDSGLMKVKTSVQTSKDLFPDGGVKLMDTGQLNTPEDVLVDAGTVSADVFDDLDVTGVGHQGTTYYADDKHTTTYNSGHYGALDSIELYSRVWGAQVYSDDAKAGGPSV